MITDSFRGDLFFLREMLLNDQPFALSRFGDGEYKIIQDEPIDLLVKQEFKYEGESYLRKELIDSFTYNAPNYFIGIACACCAGNELFNSMKELSRVPSQQLTWANIFVNANYEYFQKEFPKIFNRKEVSLVAPGHVENLGFKITKHYPVGPNAWIENASLYEEIKADIKSLTDENHIFLFCAGPFANILCHKYFKRFPMHTFIDIGSVFNIELGIGANRKYLKKKKTAKKMCHWDNVQEENSRNFLRRLLPWAS